MVLSKGKYSDIHKGIYSFVKFYINDKNIIKGIQYIDPFREVDDLHRYDKKIREILSLFNLFQKMEVNLKMNNIDNIKIMYLGLLNTLFNEKDNYLYYLSRDRVNFSLNVLDTIDITSIKDYLEDTFFAFLEPELYFMYKTYRDLSTDSYKDQKENIKNIFEYFLEGISLNINVRLKSIYSIHKKLLKKNIIYSQLQDTLGFRILTNTNDDCYLILERIIKHFDVVYSKIKDYIAFPKKNGYKSLHLTVIYKNMPIEVQIRTYKMHNNAEYGKASHLKYKLNKFVF